MKNSINLKEKFQYILSIILFLCTIVFFPSISSLLFAITAIIILPGIWKKLTTHINGKVLFVICIILFFVSCSISPNKAKETPASTEQNNIISNNTFFNNTIENNLTNTNSTLYNVVENNITNTSTTEPTTKSSPQTKTNTDSTSSSSTSTTDSSKGSSSSASSKTDATSKSKKSNSSTSSSSSNNNSDTVWIGETGNKYHRQSCPTLKGKGHAISLSEAKAQGREPCKVCYK